ncbi:MAG: valine--tRNA ligase [Ignavibacteria bacterium GWF2_33_9]|nr:MAG: valine--tRNA ligase [Ignavibacteria bacterium GWF2_33_9]
MEFEFSKSYTPENIEQKWYDQWQNLHLFDADEHSDKPAYSILMPPPNVTGILHFGHVLNITIQDMFIRWKRMQGYEVCWFPGTDHAGIATQTRVEKELAQDKITRYDLGREKFIDKVWEWREKYGEIILEQMRKLGVSPDWKRTLFTMDESASNSVRDVFIKLFDEGLIYKGKRIINWSPLSQTALSDEEVEFREVHEHFYTMRYYFPNSDKYLLVATVRPETIYGDVAVAVNPNDERYKDLIGQNVIVPYVGREIPIIADDYADPTFGTGCVKITPAHDRNDFLVGERHNLPQINSINPDGTLNVETGEFNGIERFKARKLIVEKLKENDLIEKIEDYSHNVGFSQRGGEAVEPYLSDQWFVSMKPLAEIALKAVLDGEVKFYPNHWVKTFEHWMTGIRDWCISRQLWWGHRIPVYYTEDGRFTAAKNEAEARQKLGLSDTVILKQDEDVLDTWFSSWLWPMTTMQWNSEEGNNDIMRKFLPSDLLVTAPDIIFFWVARMIMATIKFDNQIPFKDVYFTSTIRDGKGRKLSKSLGNSPDPLNIIAKYGSDAVRFTMLYLAPLGQDIKMDVDVKAQDIPSMEIGRNFANKIWNASRFLKFKFDSINFEQVDKSNGNNYQLTFADKWIQSRLNSTIQKVNEVLANYRLNEYSKIIYDFIWRDFCDWYIEIVKVQFADAATEQKKYETLQFAFSVFEEILRIIHPLMPFISEELWHLLFNPNANASISIIVYPKSDSDKISPEIESGFELLQLSVEEIRSLRSSMNITPSLSLPVHFHIEQDEFVELFNNVSNVISVLAKCSSLEINSGEKPHNSISSVVRDIEISIILDDNINLQGELNRLDKEIKRLEGNIFGTEKKLTNEKFLANAATDLIEYETEKLQNMKSSLEKVKLNYEKIKSMV